MKTALILLFALCAVTIAAAADNPVVQKIEAKDILEKQKDVLRIFKNINQPTYYKDFVDVASNFSLERNFYSWNQTDYVQELLTYYKTDILPKGYIFSVFDEEHLKQAVALFKVLYYANDYETFFKVAVWARQNINEGLFVYAFSVAIIHRPDTQGLILPPIYEIYPYYFFPSEVIAKAQQYKQTYGAVKKIHDQTDGITIISNYSGWNISFNSEQKLLSYFSEDIGLNSYYYTYNLHYPFWMNATEFNLTRRGELFYFAHQQLLARYYLERLSNNLGRITPLENGYYPSLTYPNGVSFPYRPNHVSVQKLERADQVNFTDVNTSGQDYARRIRDAIDSGYVHTSSGKKIYIYDSKGMETLGNLIQSNPDSPNTKFYGSLLFGHSHEFYSVPSVLEHFETSLRDPLFYQSYTKIMEFFQKYKLNLPHHTREVLQFPGVKITSFKVDRLTTYFEPFYTDLSSAVYYNKKQFKTWWPIRAVQFRLAHKPFSYALNVASKKAVDAVVKIFIGPKFDEYGREIDTKENYENFVLFERFVYKLAVGGNVISRDSSQSFYANDRITWHELYKNVVATSEVHGLYLPMVDGSETHWGFPSRLLLPKGQYGGQTYQFFAHVMPYKPNTKSPQYFESDSYPKSGRYLFGNEPLGFPLDRHVNKVDFNVTNSYFQDVVIYHKKFEGPNVVHDL